MVDLKEWKESALKSTVADEDQFLMMEAARTAHAKTKTFCPTSFCILASAQVHLFEERDNYHVATCFGAQH